jgi:hypothetical protein
MNEKEFAKLKVGDRVRIVSKRDDGVCWNIFGKMDKWLGKIMTIRVISNNYHYVMMNEDREEHIAGWAWNRHMIECKVEDEGKQPTIVEHLVKGNKVIVKLSNGKVGVAACSPEDEFDICEGLKLAIDRAYGKVPGFKKDSKNVDPKVKEVKRHAKVGEWVKIVAPYLPIGYGKNSILQCVSDTALFGRINGISCLVSDKTVHSVNDSEYVVLENYKPKK